MTLEKDLPLELDTEDKAFRHIRTWVDERLAAKGIQGVRIPQTRGGKTDISREDIEQLKADIELIIQIEGKRSFRSNLVVNLIFFALGLVFGRMIDLIT